MAETETTWSEVTRASATMLDDTKPAAQRIVELLDGTYELAAIVSAAVIIAAWGTSKHERATSAELLLNAAKTPLLDNSLPEVRAEVRRGAGLAVLMDRLLPQWSASPDRPLVDLLKVVNRNELRDLVQVLNALDLHDLDEMVES